MRSIRLFAALILMGLSWGASMPLMKIAVSTGHRPLGLIVWQLLIAVVILSIYCCIKKIKPGTDRKSLIYYLLVALLGTLLPNSFSFLAIAHIPAGVYSIIIASVPMFALPIALFLHLERFSMIRMLGVLLGIIAIILLIGPDTSLPDPEKAIFVLVALIAPFCYGVEGNYIETQSHHHYNPVTTIYGASVIGLILAVPLALMTESWVDLTDSFGPAEIALVCSSLIHAVVYVGYVWMVNVSGAVFACQVAYIVTISGVFYSAMFLNETYSGWVWASLILMICGLVLVQPRNFEVRAKEPS